MLILRGRKSPLHSLTFSPDGRRLAASGAAGVVRVWDLDTQQLAGRFVTNSCWVNNTVLFRPGSDELLVLFGIRLYRFSLSGRYLGMILGSTTNSRVSAATVSPDGTRLLIGVVTPSSGALRQLGVPKLQSTWKRPTPVNSRVTALAYSRDGRSLAYGLISGEVAVCDAPTGRVVHEPEGASSEVKAVALSPDGRHVAWCAATQLHLWRLDPPGQILRHSIGRTHFLSVAFHPSGNFLATANGDGKIDYWSLSGEPLQSFDWGVGKVNDVTFDPTGDRAACCSQTGEVVVWDVDR